MPVAIHSKIFGSNGILFLQTFCQCREVKKPGDAFSVFIYD